MKFLDKLKDLFTDEVPVVEPIKKEVIKVDIETPIEKEEPIEISDSAIINEGNKTANPIFFSDSDFEDLRYTSVKKPTRRSPYNYNDSNKEQEEKKVFKPTPIISPVYGILDKNYSKDDISVKATIKKEVTEIKVLESNLKIDVIRKKAYGTLEDELESSMLSDNSILFNDPKEEVGTDLFMELKNKEEEIVHNNNDIFEDLTIDEAVRLEQKTIENLNEIIDIDDDRLTGTDLFDLIDSMYEKESDSNG